MILQAFHLPTLNNKSLSIKESITANAMVFITPTEEIVVSKETARELAELLRDSSYSTHIRFFDEEGNESR